MFFKQNELSKLKKRAAKLYLAAQGGDDLDCGRGMAELLRPSMGAARREFNEVWEKIRELDPAAPKNPLAD